MEQQRLLVDLDVILDTRLGAISQANDLAAQFLVKTNYQNRLSDDFETLTGGIITNEQFREAYLNRDKETLKRSLVTAFPLALKGIVGGLVTLAENTPIVDEVILGINYWPYHLTRDEIELFKMAINNYVGLELSYTCKFVRIPPHDFDPYTFSVNWDGYVTYDYDQWIVDHTQALINKPIPQYTLIGPALSRKVYIENAKVSVDEMGEVDAFEGIEFLMTAFVGLELLDSKYFSVLKLV